MTNKLRALSLFGAGLIAFILHAFVPVQALQIHYDATRPEALKKCDAHRYVGDASEAEACYKRLSNDARVFVRAEAASALGNTRDANRLFREASQLSKSPSVKTAWGNLFFQTHQISDAIALYREALLFDPDYHPARLGLAKAQTNVYAGQARRELMTILSQEPNHPGALIQLARLELEHQKTTEARELLDTAVPLIKALEIPPIEAYALYAAADMLDDKPMRRWTRAALELNPMYGDVFAIPAHYYIITYRYREAVALYQAAVKVDAKLATAQRDLGVNLLRLNDVFGARHHLRIAFTLDPYDAQTVNTLRLLEDLDKMRVTFFDVDDTEGNPLGRVILRLDREHADALEPYVLELSTRAMQTFTERYAFRLRLPMVVELFHDHDNFGVRTVGTPGIGLLGVSFGYLTAMDSPKARPSGDFHWGSTLWHEIAHVYTLGATNHLLPRWMSEGLSVYEEWTTGPLPSRMLSFPVLEAIRDKTLLPVASLDQGFVRPSYPGQVQVSYSQAGLLCYFIASRYGHDALKSLVDSFGDNVNLAPALLKATGLTPEGLDSAFFNHLETEYGVLVRSLEDYLLVTKEAQRALERQDWDAAVTLGLELVERYPAYIAEGSAYDILDLAYAGLGDEDAAIDNRLLWFERGGHAPPSLIKLIHSLRANDRFDEAVPVMEALNLVMPYSAAEHGWLGNHYIETGDAEKALREFNALMAVSESNPAEAFLGRARASLLLDDEKNARKHVLLALENSPFYRPAQQLLLKLQPGTQYD